MEIKAPQEEVAWFQPHKQEVMGSACTLASGLLASALPEESLLALVHSAADIQEDLCSTSGNTFVY